MIDYETGVAVFRESIETEINGRGFPGIEVSRIGFKEGGLLSSGREYLPQDFTASPEAMMHFLSNVSLASQPLTLEMIGAAEMVSARRSSMMAQSL